jgi:hypothetical protein
MPVSKIQGPAAAMFDEPEQVVSDELFNGAAGSISDMRLEIIEARLNEIFDHLTQGREAFMRVLPINHVHRWRGMK